MLAADEVLAEPHGRPLAREPQVADVAEPGALFVGVARESRHRTRRRFRIKGLLVSTLLTIALLGAVGFGWRWWAVERFIESTDDAYVQSDISVVSAKVQGLVRDVLVKDDQPVKAGDVLVMLKDDEFLAKVVEALARTKAERAAIAEINSRIRRQQSVASQAAASLTGAEAEQQRALQDLRRYQALAGKDLVSRQRLEAIQADARKADAEVERARAALAAERDEMSALEARRTQTESILSAAEAALEGARIDLDNTLVRAPVDGIVGNRAVQTGELVRPGGPLLAIVPLEKAYVVANFKETQLSEMRVGQRVDLALDAFPGRRIEGRVESFAPATGALFSLLPPENATGNFTKIVQRLPVRIAVLPGTDLPGPLRPGLSVTAAVNTRGDAAAPESLPNVVALIGTALSRNGR